MDKRFATLVLCFWKFCFLCYKTLCTCCWYLAETLCIGLLRKFQLVLPRSPLSIIYATFIPSNLYYADVVYYKNYKSPFCEKLESIEYYTALAITGATRGSFTKKLYQEHGLQFLQSRHSFRKLCQFYKLQRTRTSHLNISLITFQLL